ncbi:hypothetical protein P7K49_002615 [Saguinus oedipus]|uniref:Uncharacterized protein n=1 Tax=Saguinus oedipus TaxID=9490 RepID=A0ABQ9WHV2_SAGOE|nr:hypothetical protein P7K49_002615 [Saguinus oedipus]
MVTLPSHRTMSFGSPRTRSADSSSTTSPPTRSSSKGPACARGRPRAGKGNPASAPLLCPSKVPSQVDPCTLTKRLVLKSHLVRPSPGPHEALSWKSAWPVAADGPQAELYPLNDLFAISHGTVLPLAIHAFLNPWPVTGLGHPSHPPAEVTSAGIFS